MKTHPLRRLFLSYSALFSAIFVIILLQFTSNTSFTHSVGSMVVSGHYAKDKAWNMGEHTDERALSGPLSVIFGGLEFNFIEELALSPLDGSGQSTARPISFSRDFETIQIRLSDNSELSLKTVFAAGKETLRMSARFSENTQDITIPFDARPTALIHARESGLFTVETTGQTYLFTDSVFSLRDKSLRLSRRSPVAQYGMLQALAEISPSDLVPPSHLNTQSNSIKTKEWTQRAFRVWEREMAETIDESTILAYIAESKLRQNYHVAVSTVPRNFLENGTMTWRSSPYLGRLERSLQSLINEEQDRLARILRLAKDKSPDILMEEQLLEFLYSTAPVVLDEDIPAIARSLEVPNLTPIMAMQVIEAWTDWKRYRPAVQNPFDRLIDQSEYLITRLVRPVDDSLRLPVINERIDMHLALRLYNILTAYSKASSQKDWESLGESILLSVIACSDKNLSVARFMDLEKSGERKESDGRIQAADIYLHINKSRHLPIYKTIFHDPKSPIRILTASRDVETRPDTRSLNIAFPYAANETHYAIIQGIKPFSSLLINGTVIAGSPRFERADSSGWQYIRQNQTLLLKLKSERPIDRVRIVYIEDQPRPAPAETAPGSTEEIEANPGLAPDSIEEKPAIETERRMTPLPWGAIPRPPLGLP